jgi:hypothetical protein
MALQVLITHFRYQINQRQQFSPAAKITPPSHQLLCNFQILQSAKRYYRHNIAKTTHIMASSMEFFGVLYGQALLGIKLRWSGYYLYVYGFERAKKMQIFKFFSCISVGKGLF